MRFVYADLLINEHFWVTAAKVDSFTHLSLKQIATSCAFTIQIPEKQHGWITPSLPAQKWLCVCVCVCVCGTCVHAQNLREETDVSMINIT